jgi:hypothetical protein
MQIIDQWCNLNYTVILSIIIGSRIIICGDDQKLPEKKDLKHLEFLTVRSSPDQTSILEWE